MPGWSLYNYTFDNPLGFTDPDGRAPQGCCGGDTPYQVRQAMGQLQNQLTGIGNQLASVGNKILDGLASARDFVVDKVLGNDNIGMVLDATEIAGQPEVNLGGNKVLDAAGDAAGKISPVLNAAEGAKIMVNLVNGEPGSKQDAAKFVVELGVGATVPAASIPATVLMNDARTEGGLTNPDNHQQLSGAYSSSLDQTRAGNAHLQKAMEQARQQDPNPNNP